MKCMVAACMAALFVIAVPFSAVAGVDVNIYVPLFELFGVVQPPVVVAPSPYGYAPGYGYAPRGGYVAPPAPAGGVFYGGYWYLPSDGSWFIAAQAGGPWVAIDRGRVPYAVISGPVLMNPPAAYYGVPEGPAIGITINPWITVGGRSGGHHGRGHDDW